MSPGHRFFPSSRQSVSIHPPGHRFTRKPCPPETGYVPCHPVSLSPGCPTSVISAWQPLIRYTGSLGHTAHCQPVTRSPLCQTDTVSFCTRSPAQAVIASSVSISPSGPPVTLAASLPVILSPGYRVNRVNVSDFVDFCEFYFLFEFVS